MFRPPPPISPQYTGDTQIRAQNKRKESVIKTKCYNLYVMHPLSPCLYLSLFSQREGQMRYADRSL